MNIVKWYSKQISYNEDTGKATYSMDALAYFDTDAFKINLHKENAVGIIRLKQEKSLGVVVWISVNYSSTKKIEIGNIVKVPFSFIGMDVLGLEIFDCSVLKDIGTDMHKLDNDYINSLELTK